MPTFWPGTFCVPRCRTMMPPARMPVPSWTLTPRRLARLSRPFRVLPTPFLCAISALLAGDDLFDGDPRNRLAVAGLLAIPRFWLVFENDDLLGAILPDDAGNDLDAVH